MRILYLSQYFPPEAGATQNRALEMARGLARHGHEVTVLCEVPNHPRGVIHDGFRLRRRIVRQVNGVEVRHLWVHTQPRKKFHGRMLFYLSFMTHAFLEGMRVRRVDLVYATSPPLFTAVAGALLGRFKRCPFVMEVRDFWPEAAVQLGELRNPRAIRWAERLERWCYAAAARIVVVTESGRRRLEQRYGGHPPAPVRVIPNAARDELLTLPRAPRSRRAAWHGKFLVLYAGLMGIAQDLETLLRAARQLKREDFHFLLIGEGPVRDRIAGEIASQGLENVTLWHERPPEELREFYVQSDCAVVPLRRLPLFAGTVPSKLFDCLAAGLPVVLGVDGEARRLLEQSGGGLYVEPENPDALVDALRRLRSSPGEVAKMGTKGREFVARFYTRGRQADELSGELQTLVGMDSRESL